MKRLFLIGLLILGLIVPNICQAKDYGEVTVLGDFITKSNPVVDVRAYASINAAVTAIGSTQTTLVVPNAQTLTASLTIPSTFTLKVLQGGVITIPTGVTLTFNGTIEAENYKIFILQGTGKVVGLIYANPVWFGAVGDGVTDNTTAVQNCVNAVLTGHLGAYGDAEGYAGWAGTVEFPEGRFKYTQAVVINNDLTSQQVGIIIKGRGIYVTIQECISSTFTGSAVFDIQSSGGGVTVQDMAFLGYSPSSGVNAIRETGIIGIYKNLWFAGFDSGILIDGTITGTGGGALIESCISELNNYGISVNSSELNKISNCQTTGNSIAGIYLYGTKTMGTSRTPQANLIDNCALYEDGQSGGATSSGILVNTNIVTNISNCDISSYNTALPLSGIYVGASGGEINISNITISHTKIAGIHTVDHDNTINIIGGIIKDVGYYDQTTPWATYGIWSEGNAGYRIITGTTFRNIAGYGVWNEAPLLKISNASFIDCCRGGYGGSVNATTGAVALYLNPLITSPFIQSAGCQFYNNLSAVGKTAIYINNTEIPVANSIYLLNNQISGFATVLGTALSAGQLGIQYIRGNIGITDTVYSLPDGSIAATQSASDNSTKVATTAYVDTGLGTKVGGTGTTNAVPKFTATSTIGNSAISENGTEVNIISGGANLPLFFYDANLSIHRVGSAGDLASFGGFSSSSAALLVVGHSEVVLGVKSGGDNPVFIAREPGYAILNGHLNISPIESTVAGSTSGNAYFSMPFQGSKFKKVVIRCAALLGTASYTFPTAFSYTPVVITTSGLAASLVTTLNTTTVVVTGTTSTGYLTIEGY